MNFFYKEPRKKQLHYYKNGRSINTSLFSVAKTVEPDKFIAPLPKKLFRFSVLISDLVALNFVLILLFQILKLTKDPTNQPLFLTTNIAWIFSSYITALYFGKERFLIRTIQAYLLYTALTLLLIFLFKNNFSRPFVLLNFAGFGLMLIVSRTIFIGASSFIKNNMLTSKFIVLGYNDLSHKLVSNLRSQNRIFEMQGYFDDYNSATRFAKSEPKL